MNIFQTPEERFDVWTDYPFEPNYLEFEGLRMHYVDEGDKDAPVMLMVHGMPTSSYLYRFMIPALVANGYRCVVPDHIGFGKSDKVLDDSWYSIDKHQLMLGRFVEALDLRNITVIVQDWGGPIGLRGPVDMPDRYERLCILNTWLHHSDYSYPAMMWGWSKIWWPFDIPGERNTDMPFFRRIVTSLVAKFFKFMVGEQAAGSVVYTVTLGGRGVSNRDSPLYLAYEAPFPTIESKAGARRFPLSLPMYNPVGGNAVVQERCYHALKKWTKPAHFIWGDKDPNFNASKMREWAAVIPGSTSQLITGGAHFTQETHPQEVVEALLARIEEE